MRNPTPVTTSVSAPERRSRVNAMSTRSDPAENQLKAIWWKSRMSSPSPQTAAPIRGRSGSRCSQETSIGPLELERVELVDVQGSAAAEDGDDDRQPHRRFGRRGGDDEEHRRVSREEAAGGRARHQREAGEGEEGEVHRVEHQLDAHEDDDGVAPQHHAGRSQREEDRPEDEVVLRLVGVEEVHQIFPLATTTAATTATSSKREVTSKGRIEARYRVRPTAFAPPNPAMSSALSMRRSPCISAPCGNAGPKAFQASTPTASTTAARPMPFQTVIRLSPSSSSLRLSSMITNTNSTITAPA